MASPDELSIFILAAGHGTRMRRRLPKMLHELAGLPLLGHVLTRAQQLSADVTVIVSADNKDEIAARFPEAHLHLQPQQNGTGDALKSAVGERIQSGEALAKTCLVLYGDTPFVSMETAQGLARAAEESLGILAFETETSHNYGRIRLAADGTHAERIIEAKDLSDSADGGNLCNAGIMAFAAERLPAWLERLDSDNKAGEYYLTDIVHFAAEDGAPGTVTLADADEVMGVNSLAELAQAEHIWQHKRRAELMAQGVMMRDPQSIFLSHDTEIAEDVTLETHIVFGTGVTIARGAHIRSFCDIAGSRIGEDAIVGPFARLRPGTALGNQVRIGNFVEVKNSRLDDGAKANHLSYVGDAEVGSNSNIGAGVITCNYDGFAKNQTIIGEGVFVGSNSALVAPVTIGDEALVAAGSVIGKDIAPDALGVARGKQQNLASQGMKSRKAKINKP